MSVKPFIQTFPPIMESLLNMVDGKVGLPKGIVAGLHEPEPFSGYKTRVSIRKNAESSIRGPDRGSFALLLTSPKPVNYGSQEPLADNRKVAGQRFEMTASVPETGTGPKLTCECRPSTSKWTHASTRWTRY
ncbi:hypothetical protein BD311DRAFT_126492 [Dichomitus squalens]|uniref:Uncharacterized protein n=1 Tax=Dichomitus squalens TaxID=114155 RepID=A0A4Q9M6T1_9APHY|nr:hypothetical protein BD311DRAFT_126492 [Dichomitus squalens]